MAPNSSRIKALLLDLSGVLYEGDHPIAGGAETVAKARERGLILRFVTNTATKTSEQVLTKLHGLGIEAHPEKLFTAPDAALAYIERHRLHPYPLVHKAIQPRFASLAAPLEEADCVVLGDAREDLSYSNLNRAFRVAHRHRRLIAIGDNRYFHDGQQLCLDAGPFTRAIAWAAELEPIIVGKPERVFFDSVVASTGCKAGECLMVGDDIHGDIEGAQQAGLQTCLVRTGKYQEEDERRLASPPSVLDSIAGLSV